MATAPERHMDAQEDEASGSGTVDVELPRERICAATARRLIEDSFGRELDPEVLDDLKTIASELVNNAYEHGKGEIRLKVLRSQHRIKLEVIDQGENAPIAIRHNAFEGRGNGLRIVDLLADNWGVFRGVTHVWATLSASPPTAGN